MTVAALNETRVSVVPNLSLITPDLARRRVRSKADDMSVVVPLDLNAIKFDQGSVIIHGTKLLARNLPERVENVGAVFLLSNGLCDAKSKQWELLFVQR